MTELIHTYQTRLDMKRGKLDLSKRGFASIHTDFVNNNEKLGYRVSFSDIEIPHIPNPPMTSGEYIDMLMKRDKIFQKPSTITRFRTLLRLN